MSVPRDLTVAIVASGDELVFGVHVDTNSAAIARAVQRIGFTPRRFLVLGDDEDALASELEWLARSHAAILVTGGLGPTLDDVTRHAAARAAGVELATDEAVLAELTEKFRARGRPFHAANARQALFPRGAAVIANPNGTAPGFRVEIGAATVFALPGPPREMLPMLERDVLPFLAARVPADRAPLERRFYLFGLPESAFADRAGAWMDRAADPLLGVTASGGVLSVTLRSSRSRTAELEARARELEERFAEWIFSRETPDLAAVLVATLKERQLVLATAESCTGGLVSARVTSIAGSSAVFDRGWVTYANRAKEEQLDVDPALLASFGAVSRETALAMAAGAARRSRADVAVSVTGIAGPDGGSAEKPVGLVHFGVFARGRGSSEERRFLGLGRDMVREFAATTALDLARRAALSIERER